jgi:outer membrane protein OmpA-like peptidoglycan-associated protein
MQKKIILLLLLLIGLSGCCQFSGTCPDRPPWGLPPRPRDLLAELHERGVQIIRSGETFMIVIPSDQLFYPDSANFRPESVDILVPLVIYIRKYETVIVKVAGYTDNCGPELRSKRLSEKQAQNVASYFTDAKIDARIIYSVGYGPYHPIATNDTKAGNAQNRRIEIRFRKVVLPPLI